MKLTKERSADLIKPHISHYKRKEVKIVIIRVVNNGYDSVSLQIGEINLDKKYVKYDVVISADGKYERLSFSSFPQAVSIYNDVVAQYIAE